MLKASLAILAAAATAAGAAPTGAPAAPPQRLKAATVTGGGTVLGAADATSLASRAADGTVILQDDAGGQRGLPPLAGCQADAVGSGLIAWDCRAAAPAGAPPPAPQPAPQALPIVVTDLAGTERGRALVPYPGGNALSDTRAVGTQWVEHVSPDPNRKAAGTRLWTNWHTGEQKTIDPSAQGIWPSLDAEGLVTAYCSPVRAEKLLPGPGDTTPAGVRPVQYRAPWAIIDSRSGPARPSNPVKHRVLRCGSGHVEQVPASLTVGRAVTLGDGWAAWTPRTGSGATQLLRLSDGRRYVTSVKGTASFTSGSLWVVSPSGAKLSRVTLPQS